MKSILTAISLLSLSLITGAESPRYYLSISSSNGRQFFPGAPIAPGAPDNAAVITNFTFNAFQSDGRPQRSPFIIHRPVDPSSPVLLSNLISNTLLPEVRVVAVLRSNGSASGTIGYFYALSKARISAIDTTAGRESVDEKVTITFESMQTYFFDGVQSTLANWGASTSKSTGKNSNPLAGLFGKGNIRVATDEGPSIDQLTD